MDELKLIGFCTKCLCVFNDYFKNSKWCPLCRGVLKFGSLRNKILFDETLNKIKESRRWI